MKTLIIAALLSVLLFVTIAASQPQRSTWEYKFVYQCDERKANSQAAEGWELVNLSMAAHGSLGVGTCAFKRAR